MHTKIADAIALASAAAALHGPHKPAHFQGCLGATAQAVSLAAADNAYLALNDGLSTLVDGGKKWTASLFDNEVEPIFNTSLDNNGRPLFVESTYGELTSPLRE